MVIKRTFGERVFDIINMLFMLCLMIVTVYPFLYVGFASFSVASKLAVHRGILFAPLGFTLKAYEAVFQNQMVLIGYKNTLFYVIVGTALNLIITCMAAYALSRKGVLLSKAIMLFMVFTMFFSGGMIPTYLVVKWVGLLDSRWAMIIPSAMSAWNLIIMRTNFMSIPESMEESAKIDGANDFKILLRIIIPLSMPVITVMILFYGVANWNAWFNAMLYIRNKDLYPLQMVLRDILINSDANSMASGSRDLDTASVAETIKYSTIIVATVPILCVYPFLQKYFVKGVMVGAIKG